MPYEEERKAMVARQIRGRGVVLPELLAAMETIPRHLFVPAVPIDEAYGDHPSPIGFGQTISQPYIVASMLELSEPATTKNLLEVGSGCGYLLAVASLLFARVVGIERVEELWRCSVSQLRQLAITNAQVLCSDGYQGAPVHAPFDSIIISCYCPSVPEPLLEQLRVGGLLVAPLGDGLGQELVRIKKLDDHTFEREPRGGVRFVPLVSKRIGRR